MPGWTNTTDSTSNNLPNSGPQGVENYRPIANTAYPPGTVLQLTTVDKQLFPDFATAQPVVAATNAQLLCGVVSHDWPGFSPSDGFVSTSVNTALTRGTQFIKAVIKGAARVFVDQSGASAATITNGVALVSSRNTNGYAQGIAGASAIGGLATIGIANLPASGIGSSLTAAALAQASQTATVATPASGDTLNLTIQAPYTTANPGVAQTVTYSLTLNSTTAASATTAAAAMVAFLNAQPGFSTYFTAANVAGVITVTVNTASADFLVTFGSGTTVTGQFTIGISGMVANSLTFASSVTGAGGTTFTAGAANFASGTGYLGKVPAIITGEF